MPKIPEPRRVPAIKVKQWLRGWDQIEFDADEHRRQPPPFFFLFSLPARELRSLSGIARRSSSGLTPRAADLGIQRQHDPERSEEIAKFVEFGFPWSTLSEAKRKSAEFNDLRKPGWLPTAIVINILDINDVRGAGKVAPKDLVRVEAGTDISTVILPYGDWTHSWRPQAAPPFEVIDGQHRLWAFDGADADFQLPVVAFHGLDISWQAYLFWTINIKPKRINPSLAFDLYPLLRAEDWLDRAEGHSIYRETRSQELTEALWSNKESPWYDRINMLGEKPSRWVTQSAWIKSLTSTFIRPWHGRGASRIGGLFGSRLNEGEEVLGWSRAQQAAFLICAWQQLKLSVKRSNEPWARNLRLLASTPKEPSPIDDPAFYGPYSLIVTDQGVRGFLHVLNDLCFLNASQLDLRSWQVERQAGATDTDGVTLAMTSLRKHAAFSLISELTEVLAKFDWRTSSTPSLPEDIRRQKLVFRGSSGYREIRTQLIEQLQAGEGSIAKLASRL